MILFRIMKKCSRCKKEKNLEEFNFKVKAKGLRQLQCKECTRLLIKNHYNNNKSYYLTKAKKRNKIIRDKIHAYLKEYLLNHPCVDCGEKDIVVLEFDHKGELPKLKAVSSLIRLQASLETIETEVDKCEVRCANCHRRKTAKYFKWFKLTTPL